MAESVSSPESKRLTPKQRRFADAYLGDAKGNATEAARIAGYADPQQSGWMNKTNVEIRAYIDARLDAETLTSAEVLAELTDVARAEWRDFLQVKRSLDGEILDVRMDLSGKIKALELLGKYHKLFADRIDVGATDEFLAALRGFAIGRVGA